MPVLALGSNIMRIAVISWSQRRVGGTESYLESVIPHLGAMGNEVAFWCETDAPRDRELIQTPAEVPCWIADQVGVEAAIASLIRWTPDVLYVHGLSSPDLERRLQAIAPGVFFAHTYYGTCISGHKTFQLPDIRPCERTFGLGCLACYYPRRCGGLNPVTMVRQYLEQRSRLGTLRGYRAVITHSEHMAQEYQKHGIAARRVVYHASAEHLAIPGLNRSPSEAWHLLFLGRMERLKGGAIFLDALPLVSDLLGRPIRATFAGDGRERLKWEQHAKELCGRDRRIHVDFAGWVPTHERDQLLAASHLLVVPSLWPEPFGRNGPEAGCAGVPVAAFDVGGVREWLTDGVNGALAPGSPATPRGLAEAIARCLSDFSHYEQLAEGARQLARRFTMENHLADLLHVLEHAAAPGTHARAIR